MKYLPGEVEGEAIDIDKDGTLILRKAKSALKRVIAGDILGSKI
jgi:biotin-(acetyl-CoA carboxylase) ligase